MIFFRKFLFGWTTNPELGNSIAMTTLPLPSLIVINATNYLHHIPEEHLEILSPDSLADFLDRVQLNEIEVRTLLNDCGLETVFYFCVFVH